MAGLLAGWLAGWMHKQQMESFLVLEEVGFLSRFVALRLRLCVFCRANNA